MTVLLPAGKQLIVSSHEHLAEVKYQGDVAVRTTTGKISVHTAHQVDIETRDGDIDLVLATLNPSQPFSVQTHGAINAWFVPTANLEVLASAAKHVSIDIAGQFSRGKSTDVIVLGSGGPRVTLVSTGGDVQVRALPPG